MKVDEEEKCDACNKKRDGVVEGWEWIWSKAANRALCFCPNCSSMIPAKCLELS